MYNYIPHARLDSKDLCLHDFVYTVTLNCIVKECTKLLLYLHEFMQVLHYQTKIFWLLICAITAFVVDLYL